MFSQRSKNLGKIPLCFYVVSSLVHMVQFKDEVYYKEYLDVRKKRFKARKLQIEEKVSYTAFIFFVHCYEIKSTFWSRFESRE